MDSYTTINRVFNFRWIIVANSISNLRNGSASFSNKNKFNQNDEHLINSRENLANKTNRQQNFQKNYHALISSPIFQSQKSADLGLLLNHEKLSSIISDNPWEINIKATLDTFQRRIYQNSEIKFRIGGRILYSTSQLINAKSTSIIHDSQQAQDDLLEQEVSPEDFEDFDEFQDDLSGETVEDLNSILGGANNLFGFNVSEANYEEKIQNYLKSRNEELAQNVSTSAFFHEDREGKRFLSSPMRKVYKKIEFAELGTALIKSFHRQIRSANLKKNKLNPNIGIGNILPENILKKAEEQRALVEEQIQKLLDRVYEKFSNDEPVSFLSLLLSPDAEGIVRTLLYLLQLVNRKKLEIWQQVESDANLSSSEGEDPEDSGMNIFITPYMNSINHSAKIKE